MPYTRTQILERAIARADRLLDRAVRVSSGFTRWRLAIFILGVLCTVIPFKLAWYHTGNAALGLAILVFLTVAGYHNRLELRMHRLRLWRKIKQMHLARIHLTWDALPSRTIPLPEQQHLYAVDLDIVGPNSLLRLIDTAVSSNGRERLATWLLMQPTNTAVWRERQELIRDLTSLPALRDRVQLEALITGEIEVNGERIRSALQSTPGFPGLLPMLAVESILALATIGLLFGSLASGAPSYWPLSFGAYAVLYMMVSGNLGSAFGKALTAHDELARLGVVFQVLESRSYSTTPAFGRLCRPITEGEHRPSIMLRKLARICHALSIKAHPLFHLAVNAVVPWDLFWTQRFVSVHRQVQAAVGPWLETLAQVEAASALATFAYLHPTYCWPTMASEDGRPVPSIRAHALGHPLIAASRRVSNDLELIGAGRIILITGSNMSGKSTFLRTLGINTCLAQAGGPVCAASFEWTWSRLACCIRIDDSLTSGLSFFYAEVKRLKRILDLAHERSAPPVLFLIDEIFKGTNNRERLIGSRAFIQTMAKSNGIGLVTTHDLELIDLERTVSTVSNAHFQETVQNGSLTFDYRLRPGPCPTTNALLIMALEGLPVPDPIAKPSGSVPT